MEKPKIQNQKSKNLGFTLVEMLVSMTVFLTILSAAMVVFTNSLRVQRSVLAQQQVMQEMSYTLEYMSRALRMAKKNNITINGQTTNCPAVAYRANYGIDSTNGGISFRTASSTCEEFFLKNNQIMQWENGVTLELTSPDINIDKFDISLSGEQQTDELQPAVTLFVEIANPDGTKSQFQTTVSQRDLDVQY